MMAKWTIHATFTQNVALTIENVFKWKIFYFIFRGYLLLLIMSWIWIEPVILNPSLHAAVRQIMVWYLVLFTNKEAAKLSIIRSN